MELIPTWTIKTPAWLVEAYFLEEFIFRLRRSYFCLWACAYRESCIFILGRFEFLKKSNSVRTRGLRDSKFSHNVGLDAGTCCTQNGFAAMLGFAARWCWKKILKRDFLWNGCIYRCASFAAMCPFGVPTWCSHGLGYVRSPNSKLMSGDPEIFWGPLGACEFLSVDTYWGALWTWNC